MAEMVNLKPVDRGASVVSQQLGINLCSTNEKYI